MYLSTYLAKYFLTALAIDTKNGCKKTKLQFTVNNSNHRNEEFIEPKQQRKAFAGEGHRLGEVTPSVIFSSSSSSSDPARDEEAAKKDLNLDESKATTTVQVRLADGTRLGVKLNLSHTILDIRRYICHSRPEYGPQEFILMTTFPNKELTEEGASIEELSLQNALIVQRLK